MRRLMLILACCALMSMLPLLTHAQPTNTNSTTNSTPATKADFRDPPALLPLLLVPAAGILYLLYEKISRRRQP